MAPLIGSLCTGYGGLDMALEQFTGGRTAWVSDIDRHACTILEERFPGVPNLGDIKQIDWAEVPRVEWLTAGYPCQPFSIAGHGRGTDDPRHIFPWIAEGISVLRPRHVLLENVRGHLRRGFDVVLGTLADLGYDARWEVVRASDAGAPHKRERVFILATDTRGGQLPGAPAAGDELLVPTERGASPSPHPSGERHGGGQDGGAVGRVDGPDAGTPRERERAREVSGDRGFAAYTPAIERWGSVLGRPAPEPTDGSRLSPAFVEWMMGLPSGHVTDVDIPHTAQLKALGNGVVPQQALLALEVLST